MPLSLHRLGSAPLSELLDDYVRMSLRQYDVNMIDDFRAYNATVPRQIALEAELKRREGDQRRALLSLFEHPNMQVRLNTARATRPVAPEAARKMLQEIAASRYFPMAADAGMSIRAWDQGIYKPE
ncbi:DUF2019 domain-containing protein [Aurantimonas marianensis]|uniref:DUF2019 domain-containing protein n=1 Tax=Aurantimonas marianensis TaxID=2920428 RepID=A0A9X2HBC8_9HYPH|nr:DUF2019 domain-containing protein [Aurantimonas marianensis]MCP3053834.1 DUF2019 domain-containing protein [Aurantimonas marianensis]